MRGRSVDSSGTRKWKLSHALLAIGSIYLIFISFKFHHFLEIANALSGDDSFSGLDRPVNDLTYAHLQLVGHRNPVLLHHDTFHRKLEDSWNLAPGQEKDQSSHLSAPITLLRSRFGYKYKSSGNLTQLEEMVNEAWVLGEKAWDDVKSYDPESGMDRLPVGEEKPVSCPSSLAKSSAEMGIDSDGDLLVFLPCGLAVGSSITVVGKPNEAHKEYVPQLARMRQGDGFVWVSQFMLELQGLRVVDGEDPPKILHLNPRVRGDWSKKPILELNSCYRMQWGTSIRCDGLPSRDEDDTVDGFRKCEKWARSDMIDSKESRSTSWLSRFIGRAKKPEMTWSFPFVEGQLFVLTIQAGVEGYHIYAGGRHIASFSYRPGFTLEDATGLAIKGDVNVHSVYVTSLPPSHPSFSPDRVLEMSENWRSPPLPDRSIDLFVGIISASNHFAERMAVRKTWLQSPQIKSSSVVARFFVALNPRKEVNAMLKKEAEYFGDVVILPFMDHYELVVLKTIAICDYGVHNVTTPFIMKCDDDSFVRLDIVLKEIKRIDTKEPLYMGNLNLLHRPLRNGKWAVTYEEWPEYIYPPYANGPGYIISRDIASFVNSHHTNQSLRLFKFFKSMAATAQSNLPPCILMPVAWPTRPILNQPLVRARPSPAPTLRASTARFPSAMKEESRSSIIEKELGRIEKAPVANDGGLLADRWREIHGSGDWVGLLDPVDPLLRSELIRYGEFVQACYDSFNYDPYSRFCGNCRYSQESFFDDLGMADHGYSMTRYLYATSNIEFPNFFRASKLHKRTWSQKANWIGYIAVSGDEATARLGRRDIIVVWRGTVTVLEWVEDMRTSQQPVKAVGIPCPDESVKVESGFADLYTGKDKTCRFCKYSAREQVLSEVRKLVELYAIEKGEEVSVSVMGHSLGSALAVLNAYDIAEMELTKVGEKAAVPLTVFSFAGPRVGNARFKERFDKELGIKAIRVVNTHDSVPKVPGLVFNERVPALLWRMVEGMPWSYSHVGVELELDHKLSPFLKDTSDISCFHNLEAHLHLLDGYHGKGRRFALASGRDPALVNKSSDFLKEQSLVPPYWRQDQNKGMAQADGRWILLDRRDEEALEDHPPDTHHFLRRLGLVKS